ncbi:MAG: type II secretion system F family protein [Actinomycetota bacterium]
MTRWLLLLAVVPMWLGSALVLASVPAVRRGSLSARLLPHTPGARIAVRSGNGSLRAVVEPIAADWAERLAGATGLGQDLRRRLALVGDDRGPSAFRVRQAGASVAAGMVAVVLAGALGLPGAVLTTTAIVVPALTFALVDEHLSSRARQERRRRRDELPVVAEQLGMLIATGYSLPSALARLGNRGSGRVSDDLRRVVAQIGQGVDEVTALRQWAETIDLDGAHRLVSVLALHSSTTDLGRLISQEARNIRDELHRELLATLERRTQQVWIPVTVATLVPGVMFLLVPFLAAVRSFTDL